MVAFNQNWQLGLATDTGPVKEKNEDDYFLRMTTDGDGQELAIIAVADGMGGYQDGATASRTVIQMLENWWDRRVEKLVKKRDPLQRFVKEINQLMQKMNTVLLENGTKLGTTLSVLILYQGKYAISHVGDSRIFQLTGGAIGFQNFFRHEQRLLSEGSLTENPTEVLESDYQMLQLTEDHSWVNQQVKKGRLTVEEARIHPKRNVLSQCLGVEQGVTPFEEIGMYQSSDLFLLCSDGFYSVFSNKEIEETMQNLEKEYSDMQMVADYLVKLATFSGTRDNITVILARHLYASETANSTETKNLFSALFKR